MWSTCGSMGEMAAPDRGLILSPSRINEWTGEYSGDGEPRTLHNTGRSAQTEIFMTAYLKAASMYPEGDWRWIPVPLSQIETIIDGWKRRKEAIGDLDEAFDRCCRHGTFCKLDGQSEAYVMPTALGVKLMTNAGKLLIPKRGS